MTELKNASQHAKMFYCRHMTPGVARYGHADIYIPLDTIKKMMKSFDGKPVFIGHQDVEIQNIQSKADGYIAQTWYEPLDGWVWSKMLMTTDQGIAAAEDKKMKVSNAHRPILYGDGGTYLNIPYDKSVKASVFTHNALVEDPRYEDALIMNEAEYKDYKKSLAEQSNELHNSKKPNGEKRMLNFWKTSKEKVEAVDADTMLTLENGHSVSVGDMIKAVEEKNAAEKAAKEAEELANAVSEVEVDGVKMPVADLVAKYKELQNEKDAEEAAKKKAEDDAAAAQAEKDEQARKEKEAEDAAKAEEGQKNFDELNNARERQEENKVVVIQTASDKLALGRKNY